MLEVWLWLVFEGRRSTVLLYYLLLVDVRRLMYQVRRRLHSVVLALAPAPLL